MSSMSKINEEVLETTLESLDFVTPKTKEISEALKSYRGRGFYEKHKESIMADILKDDPEWEFGFQETMRMIWLDYSEKLDIYDENMKRNGRKNNLIGYPGMDEEAINELKEKLLTVIPFTSEIVKKARSLYIEFGDRFYLVKQDDTVLEFIRLSEKDGRQLEGPESPKKKLSELDTKCVILEKSFMRFSRKYYKLEKEYGFDR